MSSGLYDMESWRNAWGPALRTFGYFAAFLVIYYLLVAIAFYLGIEPITWLFGFLAPIYFVFTALLSLFKVLEEQKPPGVIKLL